jgi:hypothetical protein
MWRLRRGDEVWLAMGEWSFSLLSSALMMIDAMIHLGSSASCRTAAPGSRRIR